MKRREESAEFAAPAGGRRQSFHSVQASVPALGHAEIVQMALCQRR
jgi:hypothetical protein